MPFEPGSALARLAIRCTRRVILVLRRYALPYDESVKSSPLHASQILTPPGKIVGTVCQNRRFLDNKPFEGVPNWCTFAAESQSPNPFEIKAVAKNISNKHSKTLRDKKLVKCQNQNTTTQMYSS